MAHIDHQPEPQIIQGGMGAGVSGWRLANAVSREGQLGVVAGTALDVILARRLQAGDLGGHIRRALASFPFPDIAQRILDRYFVADPGPSPRYRYRPLQTEKLTTHITELIVAGNFVEIFLAKEGHPAPVGINYLEKIQTPHLPSLYGAMLAGVDVVIMGAGIPRAIPGILDRLAEGRAVEMRLDVVGATRDDEYLTHFDPATFGGGPACEVERPRFFAIVSSAPLATVLSRKASGRVDGFVVEGPTAGGHNAPPRGKLQLNQEGEPVYGDRDAVDLETIRALGRPFWLAGSFGRAGRLADALELGAAGIQVGTAFAYCEESGLDPTLRRRIVDSIRSGTARVYTDPVASPTGFPFKVLQLNGTVSDPATYERRERTCELGFLRHAYKKSDGKLGWRCAAEPVDEYVRKGGAVEETEGRKCICNGLVSNIGFPQTLANGELEHPILTSGDDLQSVSQLLMNGTTSYRAIDVIRALLDPAQAPAGPQVETSQLARL